MKYQELIILLPCHSLEDFPTHHEGDEAEGLLANWSALWHPALIASAEAMPTWYRVDDPPEELANRLILAPAVSAGELPTGFAQRAKDDGACFIRRKTNRAEIVAAALETLDGGKGPVADELAADFLALGYCYLQIELLTRQMRYASNLDEVYFNKQTTAAAVAAMQGQFDEARQKLQACFDVLAEERDHFYSVDTYFIDITMLAETTIGEPLRKQLACVSPTNLLLSGALLQKMSVSEPESLSVIKQTLTDDRVGIIGGEDSERELPLVSCESVRAELVHGKQIYEQHLGRAPEVFGRRRFGLTPNLPSVLQKLGFTGAIHATFEDGQFPEGSQIKVRWEGRDGIGIETIARPPLDAAKPETYLTLATKMGESMDMDHVATIFLAHWPGRASVWFDDLQRIAKYGQILGRFVTVDQYFRDTEQAAHTDRFDAGNYKSPYLKQAVIRKEQNPISTWVNHWRQTAELNCQETLGAMKCFITGDVGGIHEDQSDTGQDLSAALTNAHDQFFSSIPRESGGAKTGYLVGNTNSFARRVMVDVSNLRQLPAVERPIYAAAETAGTKQVVVDVPPLGFVWVTGSDKTRNEKRATQPLAEELMLRNEFMEVHFDGVTGAIRSLHDYSSRRNRFSQQLAFRIAGSRGRSGEVWQDSNEGSQYTVMAADSIEVTQSSSIVGEIQTRGRLLDREGKTLAGFQQTSRITRGSRVLHLGMHLDPEIEPTSDAWNSYFCCRMAWGDESSEIWRAVNNVRHPAGSKRFEAPQYIEIENGEQRTVVLTGGLPYHRSQGYRMLDTILIVRGEQQRDFELGIGIDVPYPMHAATNFIGTPLVACQEDANPPTTNSAWLFHIDSKNVVATSCQPLVENGTLLGVQLRLLETAGRRAKTTLSAFKDITSARQVDFRGEPLADCEVKDGTVRIEMAANEWVEVEARW